VADNSAFSRDNLIHYFLIGRTLRLQQVQDLINSTKKAKEIVLEWQQRTQWNLRLQPPAPRFDIARQDKTIWTYFSPKERHTSRLL